MICIRTLLFAAALTCGMALSSASHAVSYSAVQLGTLGGTGTYAYGINASGQVAGWSWMAGNTAGHAFITGANGVGMTDLGTLGGANWSQAYDINASGQVVGRYLTTGNLAPHGFITGANGLGIRDLWSLGGTGTDAYGINASGQVVGGATTVGNVQHAFITGANGVGMTDLGTLGGTSSPKISR